MPRHVSSKPTGRPLSRLPSSPLNVSCVPVTRENCPDECLIVTSLTSGCRDCACPVSDATVQAVTEPFPTPPSLYAFIGERTNRQCIPSDELRCPPECIIITSIDADCSDCACPLTISSRQGTSTTPRALTLDSRQVTSTTTSMPFPTPPDLFYYIGERACVCRFALTFSLKRTLTTFSIAMTALLRHCNTALMTNVACSRP